MGKTQYSVYRLPSTVLHAIYCLPFVTRITKKRDGRHRPRPLDFGSLLRVKRVGSFMPLLSFTAEGLENAPTPSRLECYRLFLGLAGFRAASESSSSSRRSADPPAWGQKSTHASPHPISPFKPECTFPF